MNSYEIVTLVRCLMSNKIFDFASDPNHNPDIFLRKYEIYIAHFAKKNLQCAQKLNNLWMAFNELF